MGEAAKQAIVDEMRLDALASEHPLKGALAGLRLALDFERSATRRLDRAAHSHMILFTSGTTGQPKGIELSQQAMLHAYRIGRDCLGIGEHTRSGCFYRISGLGILGINFLFPLLYGGSAVLLPLHCWADSEGFWECVERFGISFLYLVPPVVNHMVKEGSPPPRRLPLQRLLCVAGSARLDADLQAAFQRDYAALANIYGLSGVRLRLPLRQASRRCVRQLGGTCRRPGTQADRPRRPPAGGQRRTRAPVGAHAEPVLRLRQPPRPDRPGARGRLAEYPGPRLLRRGPLRARPRPLRRHHQQGRQPVPPE
ncbi:AMP-binding protein [Pseudomonas aeruginosa]